VACWLFKSEPDVFGIDDLAARPGRTEPWDGVRNYQARNFLRDQVQRGDEVFFYHSSCPQPGVAGIARIARAAYPDPTALDPASPYFDPRSTPENNRWVAVDVQLVRKLARIIPLAEIRSAASARGLALLNRGNRLSIMPVTAAQWRGILALEHRKPDRG